MVAGQFERRESCKVSNFSSEHLVDRNAGMNIRRAFLHAHAGEESATGAGMVAGAVGARFRVSVVETAEQLNQVLASFQRLEGRAQVEPGSFLCRPPIRRNRSVREVEKCSPQWGSRQCG